MPKYFLDTSDVAAIFKAVGCEAMAQDVRRGLFLDSREFCGSNDDALDRSGR